MQPAIDAFRESMNRVEHLGGLFKALAALTTSAVDATDLLRAQIVLAVSALDYYVHEITVRGMVAVFEGRRPPTSAFLKYRVPVGSVTAGAGTLSAGCFEAEVRERHSYLSFQQPDKIADAVRYFSDVRLWQQVALHLRTTEDDLKARLTLIVDRRNRIAHEADLDPSYPRTRWPIHVADVESSLSFIREVGEGIHACVA